MVETFWSAGTPSRTRLRRKKKIVHTFPPPLRQPALCSASPDSLYCAGQPVLCRTACIVAAAGPPAVRAQPNGDEDDDKEAISSAATIPPAMFLCICTMLYVVICSCRLLLLYSRIPRPPLPCDDPSAAYFYCALNGSPQLS